MKFSEKLRGMGRPSRLAARLRRRPARLSGARPTQPSPHGLPGRGGLADAPSAPTRRGTGSPTRSPSSTSPWQPRGAHQQTLGRPWSSASSLQVSLPVRSLCTRSPRYSAIVWMRSLSTRIRNGLPHFLPAWCRSFRRLRIIGGSAWGWSAASLRMRRCGTSPGAWPAGVRPAGCGRAWGSSGGAGSSCAAGRGRLARGCSAWSSPLVRWGSGLRSSGVEGRARIRSGVTFRSGSTGCAGSGSGAPGCGVPGGD